MSAAARVLLALGALSLAVWAGGQLRVAVLTDRGRPDVSQGLSPEAVREAESNLRRAMRVARSSEPDVALAQLLLFGGRDGEAAAVMQRVVAREPENADAWGLLSSALRGSDPQRAAVARERYRELKPPVPGPG